MNIKQQRRIEAAEAALMPPPGHDWSHLASQFDAMMAKLAASTPPPESPQPIPTDAEIAAMLLAFRSDPATIETTRMMRNFRPNT